MEKISQYQKNREQEYKATKANLEKNIKDQDLNINSLMNKIMHLEQDLQ